MLLMALCLLGGRVVVRLVAGLQVAVADLVAVDFRAVVAVVVGSNPAHLDSGYGILRIR